MPDSTSLKDIDDTTAGAAVGVAEEEIALVIRLFLGVGSRGVSLCRSQRNANGGSK
jgi:hypothetical protein